MEYGKRIEERGEGERSKSGERKSWPDMTAGGKLGKKPALTSYPRVGERQRRPHGHFCCIAIGETKSYCGGKCKGKETKEAHQNPRVENAVSPVDKIE